MHKGKVWVSLTMFPVASDTTVTTVIWGRIQMEIYWNVLNLNLVCGVLIGEPVQV